MHESIAPSFLALIAALLVFLVSALQLRLWMRALIWLGGYGLLVWTGIGHKAPLAFSRSRRSGRAAACAVFN